MLGFVLAGGGARGAYEAGVLRFVYDTLARRLGAPVRPDILSGTSIGAITGAVVGSREREGALDLSAFFQALEPSQIYNLSAAELFQIPFKTFWHHEVGDENAAILDAAPLHATVRSRVDWARLHARIDARELSGLIVATTDVGDGRCVQFVDGVCRPRITPTARMLPVRITADHILGSSALPFIFPPVRIDGRWYVDGSLRQNTPLSPVVYLGAERVLVIGVQPPVPPEDPPERLKAPTPLFLAGKALDALMLDPVVEDIRHTQAMNELLTWAEGAYPGFGERMAREFRPYHHVEVVHIRPSEDLGRMASLLFPDCRDALPYATRQLFDLVTAAEPPQEADLVSYLLFHHAYTAEVEALGYRDAAAQEEALARLLSAPDEGSRIKDGC